MAQGLSPFIVQDLVSRALAEDLGLAGDITTVATVSSGATAQAAIVARKPGVVCGLDFAEAAFAALDPDVSFERVTNDGDSVVANTNVARISGNAQALLSAERVALNFLCHLSGIATLTRHFAEAVRGTTASIVDTRKTTPGLRAAEKFAVRCGGGHNHRSGLFDAILIKDNHIVAAGGIGAAIEAAEAHAGHMVKIEVEVDTLAQLEAALQHNIDAVLLDNMTTEQLREAVRLVDGRVLTEASGGVNLDTVQEIAETGVDLISVGALTHSAPILDLALDFEPASRG
jgi:nicotinate-nucleotide pyrophosphorylase (carboxylating)